MADDIDELVVTIEPELPLGEVTKTETPPRDETGKFTKAAAEPVDDLTSQFEEQKAENVRLARERDAERERAANAEREAARARQAETEAKGQVVEREYDTVVGGIDAAQAEADAAEREYKAAFDAGDLTAAAAAQRKMARAESRIGRLTEAKADLEVRKTVKPAVEETRRTPEQSRPTTQPDPVEAFLANRTDATRNWLRAHPEHARALALQSVGSANTEDNRRASKLNAAHSDAIAEGMRPDTPEYFSHVEAFIGINGKTNGHTTTNTNRRRPTVPAAPVNASGGGLNGGPVDVYLSRGEALAATDGTHIWNYDDPSPQKRFKKGDPIGTTEFARRKGAMQKSGQYDRTYTEQ